MLRYSSGRVGGREELHAYFGCTASERKIAAIASDRKRIMELVAEIEVLRRRVIGGKGKAGGKAKTGDNEESRDRNRDRRARSLSPSLRGIKRFSLPRSQ